MMFFGTIRNDKAVNNKCNNVKSDTLKPFRVQRSSGGRGRKRRCSTITKKALSNMTSSPAKAVQFTGVGIRRDEGGGLCTSHTCTHIWQTFGE